MAEKCLPDPRESWSSLTRIREDFVMAYGTNPNLKVGLDKLGNKAAKKLKVALKKKKTKKVAS
jgi:hypothetical protein